MENQKKFCPECGQELTAEQKFCSSCGAQQKLPEIVEEKAEEIVEPVETKVPEKVFCINCGSEMKDGIEFCGECGTPKNAVAPVNRVAQTAPAVAKTSFLKHFSQKQTLIAAVVAAVVVIGLIIWLAMPKGLSGTYKYSKKTWYEDMSMTMTFDGNHVKLSTSGMGKDDGSVTSTYKISGDKITFGSDEGTGKLSNDKKSITFDGLEDADGNPLTVQKQN